MSDVDVSVSEGPEINVSVSEGPEINTTISESAEINVGIEDGPEVNVTISEGPEINVALSAFTVYNNDHSILNNLDYASSGHTGFQEELIAGTGIDITGTTISSTGFATWGLIAGTLSNQTDLQAELDLKYDAADFNTDFDTQFATKDTDDLSEGSTNLYDKIVAFAGGTNVTIGGTYPNFTITDNSASSSDLTTHTSDSTIHFTESSIDHANIQNIGTNTHSQIDSHISDSTIHFAESSIDHTNIQNIGTNTHAQIDTHVSDSTIHFAESSIDHTAIQNIGTNTHAEIDSHISSTSNPHSVSLEQARTQNNQIAGQIDMNTNKIIGLASPTIGTDAASKDYVDNLQEGLKWKQSCLVATTGDITLSGEQTIDGVLTSSSRVLVKDQSTGSQNGIYISSSGAWSRSLDADSGIELVSAAVNIEQGTANADVMFVCTNDSITIGATSIIFITLGSTISHNNTTGLQGGTSGEYYHLTSAEYSDLSGGDLGSLIEGSILFAGSGGVLSQDNSNLFYDSTNKRVRITTPSVVGLEIERTGIAAGKIELGRSSGAFSGGAINGALVRSDSGPVFIVSASGEDIDFGDGTTLNMKIDGSTGNLSMNSNNIISLADPIADQDAATKIFVETSIDSRIEDGSSQGQLTFYDTTASKWLATSGIVWDKNGEFMGLGDPNPATKLSLREDVSNGPRLRLTSTNESGGWSGFELYGVSGVAGTFAGGWFKNQDDERLAIWTGQGEAITILQDMKVGINKINPTSMFYVADTGAPVNFILDRTDGVPVLLSAASGVSQLVFDSGGNFNIGTNTGASIRGGSNLISNTFLKFVGSGTGIEIPSDAIGLFMGAGRDSRFRYDGSKLTIDSALVGSGPLVLNGLGGSVGIGRTPTTDLFELTGDMSMHGSSSKIVFFPADPTNYGVYMTGTSMEVRAGGAATLDGGGQARLEVGNVAKLVASSTKVEVFDDFVVDTTTFFVDATNNKVGLKTLTPQAVFHNVGDTRLGDQATNYLAVTATGDVSFTGSAGFYPRLVRQDAEPANGTGATQIDDEEVIFWIDTNDSNRVYLMYNDNTNTQIVKVELV